jgi:hypothetical protein
MRRVIGWKMAAVGLLAGGCAAGGQSGNMPNEGTQQPKIMVPRAQSDQHTGLVRPQPDQRRPTRTDLVQAIAALHDCKIRPYVDGEIVEACEPYLILWRGRMDSVELLVAAMSDERRTRVTNWGGGHYTVADLAWSVLVHMIPDLHRELIPESMHKSARWEECGECALWDELARPGARAALQKRFETWLARHQNDLEWETLKGSPVDGCYRLRR